MTEYRTYAIPNGVGRKREYPVRITLPLAEGVTERLDALAAEGETRLDVIRAGIDQEIKRRERLTQKKRADHDT